MAHGLSEDQVNAEMAKMISFIQQEANEKANEINARAQEEFSIEKGNLVQQEKIKISANYEKKMKQVEVQRKITYSTKLNAQRLRILQARERVLDDVRGEAHGRLTQLTSNPSVYQKLLSDLILQGLLSLMESNVTVVARKADASLVSAVLADVAKQYQAAMQRSVNVSLDQSETLPQDSAGGVILSANGGRIRCNNTLDARLELVFDAMLPDIRTMLFGINSSRTHYS